nr:reverse transcriptase domain-containing protein [Tanacetum cinerariifolium]
MSTRSSARNLFPPLDYLELTIRRRSRVDPTLLNDFEMSTEGNGDPQVPDLRTMEKLCQPTLNGRGGPIAPIAIQETNFGLKNNMIQQVQNSCQFHGLSGDDANKHLDKFLHVTQSIKVNGVTDDAFRLYLFPHSLTHHAIAWFDHFPRNSINTFEQMTKMFLGKYFPPFMVTKLKNEITNFRQRPDESLFEAWERYKLLIDRCPNHNMLSVTQIDTFYNGLTLRHRDTINVAAGGTFMKRRPEECYDLIKNMTAHHNDWDTSAQRTVKLVVVLILTMIVQPPLAKPKTNQGNNHGIPQGNNQGRNQFFQGASRGQNPPPAYQAPAYQASGYQALVHQPVILQPQVVTTTEFINYMKANDALLKNMQTNMTSLTNFNLKLKNMFGQFMKMNTASSSGSVTLLSNTVTNSKEDLKGITTRSGIAYQGPTIPTTSSSSPQVVERDTKFGPTIKSLLTNKDKLYELARTPLNEHCSAVLLKKLPEKLGDPDKFLIPCDFSGMDECLALANFDASINLMPLSVWNKLSLLELTPTLMTLELADRLISRPIGVTEDVFIKVGKFHFPADFIVVDFDADPRVPLILERYFLRTEIALIDVYARELTLRVNNKAVTFNLDQTSRYSAKYNDMMANRIDVIDMACEEYSQEVLGFSDVITSGNPTPYYDLIISTSSLTLTPFGDSDFLFEEVDAFLALEDNLTSPEVDHSYYDTEREILLLEAFLNNDPSLPPPNQGMYFPQVKLKDLPTHLEYPYLEGDDKLPNIIVKDLNVEEKAALIKVLKSHKQSIAWKLSDIKVFMDDFLVFENSFGNCLSDLEKMLKRCKDTNLCLNWEKSHFMVKEGIVLGHKISKNGIEVDVIAKLPHPTTVKGIRSFLGHAGFYQKFIKDFSKIAQSMTRLLEKDTQFETPHAIISDRGTHFCNDQFAKVVLKYGVTHRLAAAYYPQTSGQVEDSNHGLKIQKGMSSTD